MITEISDEKAVKIADKIADYIVKRKMASAAILMLEAHKPFSFLFNQGLYAVGPFAEIFFQNPESYQEFAAFFEKRENVDILIKRIENLDDEMYFEEREKRRKARKRFYNKIKSIFKKKKQKKT